MVEKTWEKERKGLKIFNIRERDYRERAENCAN
jgi:hypothetical protein